MGKSAGRSGSVWRRLKAAVYDRRRPCCRCGQAIDYSLPYRDGDGRIDSRSKSVDHYPHPLSTHPHLAQDLANLAAAHLGCNLHAGDRGVRPEQQLGTTTEEW